MFQLGLRDVGADGVLSGVLGRLIPALTSPWTLTGSTSVQAGGALSQHPRATCTCTDEFLVLRWIYRHPSTTSWGGLMPALTNSWSSGLSRFSDDFPPTAS